MMRHKREHWHDQRQKRIVNASEIGWMEMWRIQEYTVED